MAGFLDKNTRIVDMILTGYGRSLLSEGKLRFVYWMPFDDEVHYDPFISESGTLNSIQLSQSIIDHIEDQPIREAVAGYPLFNKSGSDYTNVIRPIFSMPQSQQFIPRMSASDGPTGSLTLETQQQKISDVRVTKDSNGNVLEQIGPIDRGYQRFNTTAFHFQYQYTPGSYPSDYKPDGFTVRVFRSGAEGTVEVKERRDGNNVISFNNDLQLIPGSVPPGSLPPGNLGNAGGGNS
jgi:hypothetical protein